MPNLTVEQCTPSALLICIKNCSIVKQENKVLIIQLLDKYLRGAIKLHPFSTCLASLSNCAKEVQFYCPSRIYAAIPYCIIFPNFRALWYISKPFLCFHTYFFDENVQKTNFRVEKNWIILGALVHYNSQGFWIFVKMMHCSFISLVEIVVRWYW